MIVGYGVFCVVRVVLRFFILKRLQYCPWLMIYHNHICNNYMYILEADDVSKCVCLRLTRMDFQRSFIVTQVYIYVFYLSFVISVMSYVFLITTMPFFLFTIFFLILFFYSFFIPATSHVVGVTQVLLISSVHGLWITALLVSFHMTAILRYMLYLCEIT